MCNRVKQSFVLFLTLQEKNLLKFEVTGKEISKQDNAMGNEGD